MSTSYEVVGGRTVPPIGVTTLLSGGLMNSILAPVPPGDRSIGGGVTTDPVPMGGTVGPAPTGGTSGEAAPGPGGGFGAVGDRSIGGGGIEAMPNGAGEEGT